MRTIDKIRYILNVLFLVMTAASAVIYLVADSRTFLYVGAAALTVKVFEFILRFVN